jgi:hypothetical protein
LHWGSDHVERGQRTAHLATSVEFRENHSTRPAAGLHHAVGGAPGAENRRFNQQVAGANQSSDREFRSLEPSAFPRHAFPPSNSQAYKGNAGRTESWISFV